MLVGSDSALSSWLTMKEAMVETGEKIEREIRFYITSLALLAILLGPIGRGHWAI